MEQFFADYLERLQSLHDDMKTTFKALSQTALDGTRSDNATTVGAEKRKQNNDAVRKPDEP
jgi:hypothetical protein